MKVSVFFSGRQKILLIAIRTHSSPTRNSNSEWSKCLSATAQPPALVKPICSANIDTILGVVPTYAVENIFPHIASYIAEKARERYTSVQPSAQTEKNVRSNDDDELIYESHGPSSIGLNSCSEMAQEKPEHRTKDSAISELKLSPCAPPQLTVRSIYALNKREWLNIEFLGSEKTKPFDSMGQARMESIYWAQEKTVTVVSTSRTTTDMTCLH